MRLTSWAAAIARAYDIPLDQLVETPPVIPYWHRCPLCREREIAVPVSQGERVCVDCAQDIPYDMLPEDWR